MSYRSAALGTIFVRDFLIYPKIQCPIFVGCTIASSIRATWTIAEHKPCGLATIFRDGLETVLLAPAEGCPPGLVVVSRLDPVEGDEVSLGALLRRET